jgi:phage head maturation protease
MNPEFKTVAFELKALDGENANGEFEAVLSTPDLDRDGETVMPRAFDPLPKSIPVHFSHDFVDKVPPVGRATPYYDGDTLKVKGTFASTPRAQELRALVNEGVIDSMSAGFLTTKKKGKSIIEGDLIEGSLTATPVNRSALLLRSKALAELELKAGARNSSTDGSRLQQIHDLSVENGADCSTVKSERDIETKAIDGSYEDLQEDLREALLEANTATLAALYPNADPGDYAWRIQILGTFPDRVVYSLDYDNDDAFQVSYTVDADGEEITLGTPEAVTVEQVVTPSSGATPETAAAPAQAGAAAKSLAEAEDEETALRLRARAMAMTAEAAAV